MTDTSKRAIARLLTALDAATLAKTNAVSLLRTLYEDRDALKARVKELEAQGRSEDAAKYNAPRHFGKSMEAAVDSDGLEILPVGKPTLRRAKARRNKV